MNNEHTVGNGSPSRENKVPSSIRNGWFSETEAMWPGQKLSIALEEFSDKSILFNEKSDFQSILVFRSAQHGNILVLDGVVQLTENDEFAYQEMISHLPMFSHSNPRRVLIVGGGDGGVLREVCRHDCVESITMVEIDGMVIDVAKKFFADSTATSFDDPRLTIIQEDAAEFLKRHNQQNNSAGYDIIIADSSDPVGPAETLFDPNFYEHMYEALNDGGIISAQGECFWTHTDLIVNVVACCADIFDSVEYSTTMVPTYPCGQIGFILAAKGDTVNLRRPYREMSSVLQEQLRWYNPSVHRASFVVPHFLEEKLSAVRPSYDEDIYVGSDEEDEMQDNVDECFLSNCTIT